MRYTVITICALLLPACSNSKEKPSADNEKPTASEATSVASTEETTDATLPDWSKLFASGLCPLSGEEIQSALGLAEKVSTKEEYAACWFRVGDKNIGEIAGMPTSEADIAKQKKNSAEDIEMGLRQMRSGESSVSANLFSQIKLADPTLYAEWRGSSYSHLNIYTRDRIVRIKSMAPIPPSPQGQEAYDATKDEREAAYLERQTRAIKIANALSAKAK